MQWGRDESSLMVVQPQQVSNTSSPTLTSTTDPPSPQLMHNQHFSSSPHSQHTTFVQQQQNPKDRGEDYHQSSLRHPLGHSNSSTSSTASLEEQEIEEEAEHSGDECDIEAPAGMIGGLLGSLLDPEPQPAHLPTEPIDIENGDNTRYVLSLLVSFLLWYFGFVLFLLFLVVFFLGQILYEKKSLLFCCSCCY